MSKWATPGGAYVCMFLGRIGEEMHRDAMIQYTFLFVHILYILIQLYIYSMCISICLHLCIHTYMLMYVLQIDITGAPFTLLVHIDGAVRAWLNSLTFPNTCK